MSVLNLTQKEALFILRAIEEFHSDGRYTKEYAKLHSKISAIAFAHRRYRR